MVRVVRAVFFDLDGCLIDSREPIALSVNHALEAMGLPPRAHAEVYRYIGPPLLASFRELLADGGVDPALAVRCVDRYREVYPELARLHTTVVPGIDAVLAATAEVAAVAVVTSKPAAFAGPLLESTGLATWVAQLHAPDLDELEEPKSEALRRALRGFGLDADDAADTWMVGDRHHDIDAGRECGTATAGVTWGIGERAELEAAGADVIVDTPGELARLLTSS